MSRRYTDDELMQLGVTRTIGPGRGHSMTDIYTFKCASCGLPVTMLSLILSRPVYCNLCKTDARNKVKAAKTAAERKELELNSIDTVDANKQMRFQKAADIMRKIGGYDAAIKKAEGAYDKFDSVPEAIAAIALLHAGYKVIAQQRISDFRVDFLLPDEKTVIEIDGALFHKDASKREMRDICIRYNLGKGWNIIHVPAEDVVKRPKVFEKLIARKLNGRFLPKE